MNDTTGNETKKERTNGIKHDMQKRNTERKKDRKGDIKEETEGVKK